MQPDEIRAFVNKNKICFLATSDGEQVHVRGMRVYRADADGLLIKVLAYKPVCTQMREHPQVELCFFDEQHYQQLRLNGRLEEIDDSGLREEVAANCPHYQRDIREHGIDVLRIFRLREATGSLWSGDMLDEHLKL